MIKTVFIDRDGVINQNRTDHVKCWNEFQFIPAAVQAMVDLSQSGFRLVVVTNQAVINRGMVSRETVEEINARMIATVENQGGSIAACLYCPHRSEENCNCRKPQPGLFYQARQQFGAGLIGDYLIGDHINDIEAGRKAGCLSGLVLTGRGKQAWRDMPDHFRASLPVWSDLQAAARWIIAYESVNLIASTPSFFLLNQMHNQNRVYECV